MTARPLRALRTALRRAAHAYAATAWVYRYGPGFAPTAPVYVAGDAHPAAAPAARTAALGTVGRGAAGSGAAGSGAAGRAHAHAPASRSPAHASASA